MPTAPNTEARPPARGGNDRRTNPRGPSYIIARITGDPARAVARMRMLRGVSVTVLPARQAAGRSEHRPDPTAVIDRDAFAPDARALALLHGTKIAAADLRASGGAFDLQAVRTLLRGISRQRVERMVRDGSLLAVPGPSNRRSYPTVQFQADGTVVPGLKAVRAALPTRNPWAVLNFLVQPDDQLNGRTPIEALKAGAVDDVVAAARSMGQQGA